MPTKKIRIKSSGEEIEAKQYSGINGDLFYVYDRLVYESEFYREDEIELIK